MRFQETELKGAWIVDPVPMVDERGSFARSFCEREFAEHGLNNRFVQHSRSHSVHAGTLRGMHFQEDPNAEVKLVGCLKGAIFDVAVDLRRDSPTYLKWTAVELNERNGRQLYIPKGFAHGFMTLCNDAVVNYLISEFHVASLARGFRWDDPAIGIVWPRIPTIISQRDLAWTKLVPDIG